MDFTLRNLSETSRVNGILQYFSNPPVYALILTRIGGLHQKSVNAAADPGIYSEEAWQTKPPNKPSLSARSPAIRRCCDDWKAPEQPTTAQKLGIKNPSSPKHRVTDMENESCPAFPGRACLRNQKMNET
jgi:hypothetical protein